MGGFSTTVRSSCAEGTVLGFIVLCELLGRSTTSPPQGWWEAHRLPLRIVAGEAVKLM